MADVRTPPNSTQTDNIRTIFGASIARSDLTSFVSVYVCGCEFVQVCLSVSSLCKCVSLCLYTCWCGFVCTTKSFG